MHSGIAMCDKIIQQEEKFFYEPGGALFNSFIYGDKDCLKCEHCLINPKNLTYKCRGMNFDNHFELRIAFD